VGSSSTSTSGRPSSALASETRALAAGHRVHDLVGERRERDGDERVVDPRAGHAQDARDVAQVLARGQVGVDGGRLGDVGNRGAQSGRPRGLTEHLDFPRLDHLSAHQRPHQGGLAAAAGSQQPGHASRQHARRYLVQHRPAAAPACSSRIVIAVATSIQRGCMISRLRVFVWHGRASNDGMCSGGRRQAGAGRPAAA
jgi:hypothetical protein